MHQALVVAVVKSTEVTAKNPLVPETKEIVWAVVSFVLVFALLAKFAFPAIKKGLAAREARIREDLEKAEKARLDGEATLSEYQQQLAAAKADASRIIDEARQAAEQVRADLIARAEADAQDIRTRAQDDIRVATERATSDLQVRVGKLSIDLAEKIVEHNLDRDTQMALVESYINQVGSN